MHKLRGLLKELGGSEELIASITEEFAAYAGTIRKQYKKEFDSKIEKARVICLEEVNKEKVKMARKLSIYLESKTGRFERAAEKQRLNEETESVNLLKRTKALLEGVQVEDGQSRELQVSRRQVTRLQQAVGSLREERNLAVSKANKANSIAKDVLQRNRLLESKTRSSEKLVSESKKRDVPSTPNKRTTKRTVLAETTSKAPRRKRTRLDEDRRVPQQPNSTRRVLDESKRKGGKKGGDKNISNIAASME